MDGKVADAVLGRFGSRKGAGRDASPRRPSSAASGRLGEASLPQLDAAPRKDQFVAALEGKGARDPLDHPFAGRRMSAVDQAYRYAINLPCDWIIVTSMCEAPLLQRLEAKKVPG